MLDLYETLSKVKMDAEMASEMSLKARGHFFMYWREL